MSSAWPPDQQHRRSHARHRGSRDRAGVRDQPRADGLGRGAAGRGSRCAGRPGTRRPAAKTRVIRRPRTGRSGLGRVGPARRMLSRCRSGSPRIPVPGTRVPVMRVLGTRRPDMPNAAMPRRGTRSLDMPVRVRAAGICRTRACRGGGRGARVRAARICRTRPCRGGGHRSRIRRSRACRARVCGWVRRARVCGSWYAGRVPRTRVRAARIPRARAACRARVRGDRIRRGAAGGAGIRPVRIRGGFTGRGVGRRARAPHACVRRACPRGPGARRPRRGPPIPATCRSRGRSGYASPGSAAGPAPGVSQRDGRLSGPSRRRARRRAGRRSTRLRSPGRGPSELRSRPDRSPGGARTGGTRSPKAASHGRAGVVPKAGAGRDGGAAVGAR